MVATAGGDRTIKLWQRDGILLKTLFGHEAPVWQVGFSPGGRTIISASEDRSAIIWDLPRINNLDLLAFGCNWVEDYLAQNPQAEDKDICQDVELQRP